MEGNVFSLEKAMVSEILNLQINEEFPSAQCIWQRMNGLHLPSAFIFGLSGG